LASFAGRKRHYDRRSSFHPANRHGLDRQPPSPFPDSWERVWHRADRRHLV
jgi:hypothetical protein